MHAQAAKQLVSELPKSYQGEQRVSDSSLDTLLAEVEATMVRVLDSGLTAKKSAAHQAAAYHVTTGGQRIRARLALHAARCMQLNTQDAVAIASAVELIHNASLVHDDIQDEALERRGQQSVWALHGTNVAICAGDLLLSAAYCALATLASVQKIPLLLSLAHKCVSKLIHGQCAEVSASPVAPSFHDYEAVAAAKSGALLSLPFDLVFTAAERLDHMRRAVEAANSFALGYQIMDDIADIDSDIARAGHPLCANAVLVLRANGAGDTAEQLARAAGIAHLKAAAKMADSLPNGAGLLLKDMALKLCGQP